MVGFFWFWFFKNHSEPFHWTELVPDTWPATEYQPSPFPIKAAQKPRNKSTSDKAKALRPSDTWEYFCSLRQEQTSHKRHNTTRKAFPWIPPLTLELVREETEVRGSHWSFCAFPQAKVGAQMVFCSATMAQNWARDSQFSKMYSWYINTGPACNFRLSTKTSAHSLEKQGCPSSKGSSGGCR